MRGSAGYGIGQPNAFAGSSSAAEETEGGSALDSIRAQTSKIEDLLDTFSEPIKPYAACACCVAPVCGL